MQYFSVFFPLCTLWLHHLFVGYWDHALQLLQAEGEMQQS